MVATKWAVLLTAASVATASNLNDSLPGHDSISDTLFPMPPCGPSRFRLEEATIADMQSALSRGLLTSVQLVECYEARVRQTDDYINSLLELNPDVVSIAAARDAERRAGRVRGPLH